jgi:hypothetical protein
VKLRIATKYRRELDEYILPALGDRDFESVTRADVQALHASLRHIPSTANYVVAATVHVMVLAVVSRRRTKRRSRTTLLFAVISSRHTMSCWLRRHGSHGGYTLHCNAESRCRWRAPSNGGTSMGSVNIGAPPKTK